MIALVEGEQPLEDSRATSSQSPKFNSHHSKRRTRSVLHYRKNNSYMEK